MWRGILIINLLKETTRLNVHSARIPELFDIIPLREEVREDEIKFLKWDRRRNELGEVEDRWERIDIYSFESKEVCVDLGLFVYFHFLYIY